jgi:hypothetical protein
MSRNRFKGIALYAIATTCLLLALIALLFVVEHRRTHAETGAVLSAFFAQDALRDVDKWDTGRTAEVVILRHPDCVLCPADGAGPDGQSWFAPSLRVRGVSLSDAWFAQSSRTTRASFFVNSIFPTDISTDLCLPSGVKAIFVYPSDLRSNTSGLEARFANNLGYFVISHVGLNLNKTEALLYVEHFCGGLCGGGNYILMRKVNGAWRVVDHHLTWVS